MTYYELVSLLDTLTDEQLQQTATIYIPGNDEYYPLYDSLTVTDEDCDVLDKGHIVLTIE